MIQSSCLMLCMACVGISESLHISYISWQFGNLVFQLLQNNMNLVSVPDPQHGSLSVLCGGTNIHAG